MDNNSNGLTAETAPATEGELSYSDIIKVKELSSEEGRIVYLAKHKDKDDQLFALKVIERRFYENEKKATNSEQRINQSVSTNSQYVVNCYGVFVEKKHVSILLEYMDCGTLKDLLEIVQTIPELYLAAICKQLLMGLFYLHSELKPHVIHRDLKPSNFFINQKGEAKISDFGGSAIVNNTSSMRETETGSEFYMAPERITGDDHNIRSDIWSLGIAVLELANGQFPYTPPENSEYDYLWLERIVDEPPPQASPEQFSEVFCSFIAACLRKDPKERSSARQLLEHPFIKNINEEVDLSSYFKMALIPL